MVLPNSIFHLTSLLELLLGYSSNDHASSLPTLIPWQAAMGTSGINGWSAFAPNSMSVLHPMLSTLVPVVFFSPYCVYYAKFKVYVVAGHASMFMGVAHSSTSP